MVMMVLMLVCIFSYSGHLDNRPGREKTTRSGHCGSFSSREIVTHCFGFWVHANGSTGSSLMAHKLFFLCQR